MSTYTNSLPILEKLYPWNQKEAFDAILSHYNKNHSTIVNYLYFARVMNHRLFEEGRTEVDKNFKKTLLESDLLFPDGIAMEVFYKVAGKYNKQLSKTWLTNLNWTDFMPYFFKKLFEKESSVHVAFYSTYDPKIWKTKAELPKAKQNFKKKFGHDVSFATLCHYKDRWKDFDFSEYQRSLDKENSKIRVFVCCIGTPFQELRIQNNIEFFKKNKIIVFNAWGFVDFLSWFEKRAPKWVVKARVLETFRRVARNPKKNLKKFGVMFWIIGFLFKKLAAKVSKISLKR